PDSTNLTVKKPRSNLPETAYNPVSDSLGRRRITQKTARFPAPDSRIIPKTQFRVRYLHILPMNSHYYCKNAHSPVGFPANGARRDGRYNRAFQASRAHHESHSDPRHAVPAEQFADRLREDGARGRRRSGRRSRHHQGRGGAPERVDREGAAYARSHRS